MRRIFVRRLGLAIAFLAVAIVESGAQTIAQPGDIIVSSLRP